MACWSACNVYPDVAPYGLPTCAQTVPPLVEAKISIPPTRINGGLPPPCGKTAITLSYSPWHSGVPPKELSHNAPTAVPLLVFTKALVPANSVQVWPPLAE